MLSRVAQVDEVKHVMTENIEKVLERGERLELLVDKTDNLRTQARAARAGVVLRMARSRTAALTAATARAGGPVPPDRAAAAQQDVVAEHEAEGARRCFMLPEHMHMFFW